MGLEHMQSTNAFLLSTLNDGPPSHTNSRASHFSHQADPGQSWQGSQASSAPPSRPAGGSLPASASTTGLSSAAAAAAEEERRRSHAQAGTSGVGASSVPRSGSPTSPGQLKGEQTRIFAGRAGLQADKYCCLPNARAACRACWRACTVFVQSGCCHRLGVRKWQELRPVLAKSKAGQLAAFGCCPEPDPAVWCRPHFRALCAAVAAQRPEHAAQALTLLGRTRRGRSCASGDAQQHSRAARPPQAGRAGLQTNAGCR